MMKNTFTIDVKDKIARLKESEQKLVCGNNDYEIIFNFDEDWKNHNVKTALFVFADETVAQVFEGNVCEGVAIENSTQCYVGVFSGDIITTTYAQIDCLMSIRDIARVPRQPTKDEYNQIIELLNKYLEQGGGNGISPTIKIVPIENGHRVIITDVNGEQSFDVYNGKDGKDGKDGYTPQKGVDYFDGKDGTSVSITSVEETTQDGGFNVVHFSDGNQLKVKNGLDGLDGNDGVDGVGILTIEKLPSNENVDNYRIVLTNGNSYTFTVTNGINGTNGTDGISASHEWNGTILTIISASGVSSADLKGEKGDKGEGFYISKTYSSVFQMELGYYTDEVPLNGFVLINTGNINDEDNAKLFVKTSTGYSYLTDLSGAQGIKGEKGDDGHTPIISIQNGYWYIDGVNTGVKAEGLDGINGTNGVGISSIVKTSTSGLVDTYTINLTNGEQSTFTVTNGQNGNSVTITNVVESTESGGSNVVNFSDGKKITIKNGLDGKDGEDYILTPADKEEIAGMVTGDSLPDYWEEYLPDKISAIKALQDEGGKDCFSFVVITDIHYATNLGKKSPSIAKKLMDECNIKYALVLGDMQNRSAQRFTREQTLVEWDDIASMLAPIADKALITQGNHDGSYGTGNAINLTPAELYNRIYRKVGMNENIHFDESGTGYYIDDNSNKVRFIILNTHCNKYELNEDGSAKYGNLDTFRFTQSQYDLVIEALNSVPTDDWSVIIGSHVPLDRSGEYVAWGGTVDSNGAQTGNPADCVVMMRMLNAFVNRTTYNGTFAGTQDCGGGYENLADTSSSDWWSNSRLDSSGNQSTGATGRNVTNYIPYTHGDVIKLKDVTLYTSDRFAIYNANKERLYLGSGTSLSVTTDNGVSYIDTTVFEQLTTQYQNGAFIRLPVQLVDGAATIITTGDLNATSDKFDEVSVTADFTNAKGCLVSYHGGHIHKDNAWDTSYGWNGAEHSDFNIIATRCDSREENETTLINERVTGTITEQSFDVFTVNKATRRIYATKIGAGADREITY